MYHVRFGGFEVMLCYFFYTSKFSISFQRKFLKEKETFKFDDLQKVALTAISGGILLFCSVRNAYESKTCGFRLGSVDFSILALHLAMAI